MSEPSPKSDGVVVCTVALVSTAHISPHDDSLLRADAGPLGSRLNVRDMGPRCGWFVSTAEVQLLEKDEAEDYDLLISVLQHFGERGYEYVWIDPDGPVYDFLPSKEWDDA